MKLFKKLGILVASFAMGISAVSANAFPKFHNANAEGSWTLKLFSELETGDNVVITAYLQNSSKEYAMRNTNGTSSAPGASLVNVENDNLTSTISEDIVWTVGVEDDGVVFYKDNTLETWLYCTNANNGVRVGTNSNKYFSFSSSGSGYLKNNSTSRYLGVYNSSDWRCYTSESGNIANESTHFYVYNADGDEPSEPISVTGVNILNKKTIFSVDEVFTFQGKVEPSNATNKNIYWTSSNPDVASIDSNGTITIVSIGTSIISAFSEDGDFSDSVTINSFECFNWIVDAYAKENNLNVISNQGYDISSISVNGFSFTFTNGSTPTRLWKSNNIIDFRAYTGATLSFDLTSANRVKAISFIGSSNSEISYNDVKVQNGYWESREDVSSVTFDITGTIKLDNIVIYYDVVPVTEYTISFNANGGTFVEGSGMSINVAIGSNYNVTLPTDLDFETTPDFGFTHLSGWDDGLGNTYMPGEIIEVSTFITFTAIFDPTDDILTVSQALELCENAGTTGTNFKYKCRGKITDIKVNNNTRNITISDGIDSIVAYITTSEELYAGINQFITLRGNLKIYNDFKEFANVEIISIDDVFTVTINYNNGTNNDEIKVTSGGKINALENPSKNGYTFINWTCNGVEWSFDNDVVTENITLLANYRIDNAESMFESLTTKTHLGFNYKKGESGPSEFIKVNENQDDWSGKYLIVYETASVAFDGSLNSLDAVSNSIDVTIENDKIVYSESLLASVFEVAKIGDNIYSLMSSSGKFISGTNKTSVAYNGMKSSTTPDDYEISFAYENNNVVIKSKSSDQDMLLKYNSASNQNRFRFYKSGQQDIALYKLHEGAEGSYQLMNTSDGKSSVNIQFGAFIGLDLYKELSDAGAQFGMLYALKTNLNGDTLVDFANEGLNEVDEEMRMNLQDLKDMGVNSKICSPVRTNASGKIDDDGAYYQYGIMIKNIPETAFDTYISATAYIVINDVYYFMEEASCTVKTLASSYVNADDTSSYSQHLGALTWLSTYTIGNN